LTKTGCRQAGALVGKSASVTQQTDDLEQHDCVQFELPGSGRPITWLFNEGGKAREMLTSGGYLCSDDVLAGVTLAKHGAGLLQTYRFIVERELAEGSLVEVLQPFSGRSRPFTLLYPHSRHMPLCLRTFMNFIMDTKQARERMAERHAVVG